MGGCSRKKIKKYLIFWMYDVSAAHVNSDDEAVAWRNAMNY